MRAPLESELGWAAGIIDGEGTIAVRHHVSIGRTGKQYESYEALVIVSNTSVDLLRRYAEIIGHSGVLRGHANHLKPAHHKFAWTVGVHGDRALRVCRMLMPPYLVTKAPQARLVIEAVPLLMANGKRHLGNPNKTALRRLSDESSRLNFRGRHPEDINAGLPQRAEPELRLFP